MTIGADRVLFKRLDLLQIWGREVVYAALMLVLVMPTEAMSAQTPMLAALVADAKSGSPIPDAEVAIDAYRLSNRTDSVGELRFPGLPPGLTVVTAFRIGYRPMAAIASLKGSDTSVVVFLMHRLTASLDTVRMLAAPWSPNLDEFYQRRKMGLGRYLTFAQLDSSASDQIADIVEHRFPGLHAAWNQSRTEVMLLSAHGPTSLSTTTPCKVAVYVDGQLRRGDDELAGLSAGALGGVEYYSIRPPPQYPGGNNACGTLLLWTKRY